MKNKLIKTSLLFILFLSILIPFNTPAQAATKTAYVDVTSGHLNFRSSPSTHARIIGSLKDNTKLTVYSTSKGWSRVKYGNKTGYVSYQYLKFYSTMSRNTAKSITDRVIRLQDSVTSVGLTRDDVYRRLSPGFTKGFIDKFFKYDMTDYGSTYNGEILYITNDTDFPYYHMWPLEWKGTKFLPKVSHYFKNGKEYLIVSQFNLDDLNGNYTEKIYMSRYSGIWKVYKYYW